MLMELGGAYARTSGVCTIPEQNTDQRCFGYEILSAIYPTVQGQYPEPPPRYNAHFSEHGLVQIAYHVEPNRVPGIKDILHININLYTFSHDGIKRRPYYISTKHYPDTIDLI